MAGRLVREVLEYAPEDLTQSQLVLLMTLAESARDQGPTARIAKFGVTLPDLVRLTRQARGTVKNNLGVLVRRGLVVPLLRAQTGTSQHYRLVELGPHHRKATGEASA